MRRAVRRIIPLQWAQRRGTLTTSTGASEFLLTQRLLYIAIYCVLSAEQADGSYPMGGAEGIYSHPEPNKESLVIQGPTTEDITLYVSERFINREVVFY